MNSNIIMAKSRSKNPWPETVAVFEDYLYQRGKSTETINAYGYTLKAFGRFYQNELQKPGPYVSRLQETDFQAFIDYLRSTRYLTASSINRYIAGLRFFSHYALEKRLHKRNIGKDLRTYFVGTAKAPSRLAPQETRRLIAAVDLNTKNGKRDLAIMQLFIQAGLRVGEVARLVVNDVVLYKTTGHIRVMDEKTRSDRIVPLNASARKALKDYSEIRGEPSGSDPLFLSQKGKRISVKTIQYLVKKYLSAAGRPELSARDLRRHLACELFRKKKDLSVVQQVLGHRDPATTARYIQATSNEVAEALEKIPENVYHSESPKD